ncbi:MAG: helix-turn-helix domain-containing protein [Methanomicrobiales archaeon]|nr:helix-turn-helix domain-containing protein [Methanomicrobiales archaeon]
MPDDTIPGADGPGGTEISPLPDIRGVIVLEPGGEQAQKIAKAMGSQTAGDILQLLKTGPKTSTEVTDQLGIPMGTAKYHIDNLLDAGLIEVTKTKYSVKGREVKVYGLRDQLLIVAPMVTNVRALLLKYASLFGVVAVATVVIGAVLQVLSLAGTSTPLTMEIKKSGIDALPAATSAPFIAGNAGTQGMGLVAENSSRAMDMKEMAASLPTYPPEAVYSQVRVEVGAPAVFPLQEVLIAFFLGGCLVIAVLILYELIQKRKNPGH